MQRAERSSANHFVMTRTAKVANPFIGQVYKGDSGSKSGLKHWGRKYVIEGGVCF